MTANPFANADEDLEALSFLSVKTVALKFPTVGFEAGGTITDWEMRDQTEANSGEQQFWMGRTLITAAQATAKGHPGGQGLKLARQLVLTLQCEPTGETWEGNTYERVSLPDDDGVRKAYIKGSMQQAFAKALDDAGIPVNQWTRHAKGAHISFKRGPNKPKVPGAKGAAHTHSAVFTPAAKNPQEAAASVQDGAPANPFK